MVESKETFHRKDYTWPDADFPHLYHNYCFHNLLNDESNDALHTAVAPVFSQLLILNNELLDKNRSITWRTDGAVYHPQAIHYLAGGGYFAIHTHEFEPMRIGMVLVLSERGQEYEKGGSRFLDGDRVYDTRGHTQIGDVILFRHDLPHGVVPVDTTDDLDWTSERGRWSIIMPLHV